MISDGNTREQVLSDIQLYANHEDDLTAVMANVAAVLKAHRPQYTWVGFYIVARDPCEMILGPYQGLPTCTTRIPIRAGMCGLAARERRTVVVPDVRTDPRYIACSPTVCSEIVVPLLDGECVLGVLDVDSDDIAAFAVEDQTLLETVANYVVEKFRRRHANPRLTGSEGLSDG
ncbi:MAG: GAF domain-containing protein [Candidatus Entotheonellia bacterium]